MDRIAENGNLDLLKKRIVFSAYAAVEDFDFLATNN